MNNDLLEILSDFIYNTTHLDIIDAEEMAEDMLEEVYG